VVGDLGRVEVPLQLGEIGDEGDDALVVGLERQQGEELGLGEVAAAGGAGVGGQALLGQREGLAGDAPRGLGHRAVRGYGLYGP
jgi:hypothetical protein